MGRIDYIAKQLEYQRNILAVFATATAGQIADGKAWYPSAIETLAELAPKWDVARRAAVCAMLSPRTTWKENTNGVRKFYRDAYAGFSLAPIVAGVGRNREKAWATAVDGNVARVSGPKVSAFNANLNGDFQRVTIDVWAARAAGVPESQMDHLDGKRYRALEAAYKAVAASLFFAPAELQAIVWIVQRGHGDGTMAGTNQPRWAKDGI